MPLTRALALGLLPLLAFAAPNIVFVMSDDHAVPALSAYDSKLISTPNLDRLANEGVRFECGVRDELDLHSKPGCDLDRQA